MPRIYQRVGILGGGLREDQEPQLPGGIQADGETAELLLDQRAADAERTVAQPDALTEPGVADGSDRLESVLFVIEVEDQVLCVVQLHRIGGARAGFEAQKDLRRVLVAPGTDGQGGTGVLIDRMGEIGGGRLRLRAVALRYDPVFADIVLRDLDAVRHKMPDSQRQRDKTDNDDQTDHGNFFHAHRASLREAIVEILLIV